MTRELHRADGTLLSRGGEQTRRWKVDYTLQYCGMDLHLDYTLYGDLEDVIVPTGGPVAYRMHELWQTTCFECFFGLEDSAGYWELNLSPTGDWNLYRFTACRQGMAEENRIMQLDSVCRISKDELTLHVSLPMGTLVEGKGRISLGICAVIHCRDDRKEYLALFHPAEKPDFHNRAGWQLSVFT